MIRKQSDPGLRRHVVQKLMEQGMDRHSSSLKYIAQEIQKIIIEYREKHERTKYLYVYYDFGANLGIEEMRAIKIFLKEALVGKDCIGSINAYCNRLNGFLILDEMVYE